MTLAAVTAVLTTSPNKGNIMQGKVNRQEYIAFFTNWIHYQFPRPSERLHNVLVICQVKKLITDDNEAAYWGDRDCWTMHGIAESLLESRAIVAVEA